jgi:uncharacterized protein (DUF1501 family)
MSLNRRSFLQTSAAACALATSPALLARSVPEVGGTILVHVFLRGGLDAVGVLSPADSPELNAQRPVPLLLSNGIRTDLSRSLDWRVAESGRELQALNASGDLAWIWGVGQRLGTRSHFQAQELMDQGLNVVQKSQKGWLTKLHSTLPRKPKLPGSLEIEIYSGQNFTTFPKLQETSAVHANAAMSRAWYGESDVLALGPNRTLLLADERSFYRAYRNFLNQGFAFAEGMENLFKVRQLPEPNANPLYPAGDFGQQLQRVAEHVKSGSGLRLASVDFQGWDTHESQLFPLHQNFSQLSRGLSAFWEDLGSRREKVVIVVTSEFGRRIPSNANWGTDHGRGGLAFVIGKNLVTNKLHGETGFKREELESAGDIPVNFDYRDVLFTCAQQQFGIESAQSAFAGFQATPDKLKLFRAI